MAPLIALARTPSALASVATHPAIGGPLGIYQAAVVGWILSGILAFAGNWRVGIQETKATIATIVAGFTIGLLALYLSYSPQVATVVFNPFEKLFEFAAWSQIDLRETRFVLSGEMARHLADGFFSTLARRASNLYTSPQPTIFLEWLAITMEVISWQRGEQKLSLPAILDDSPRASASEIESNRAAHVYHCG